MQNKGIEFKIRWLGKELTPRSGMSLFVLIDTVGCYQ